MNKTRKIPRWLKILCIDFAIWAALIAAVIILEKNYLMPWQIPLYKNRKAIIQYARDVHPGNKIVEEHLEFVPSGWFSKKPDCYIVFEEGDIQYIVDASNGEVNTDFYNQRKLSAEVEKFVNENFLEPRGIENVKVGCDFGFNEYDGSVPEKWSEYNDYYTVRVSIHKQGTTPGEVGWIYDFYNFWNENTTFPPEWGMRIAIFGDAEDRQIGELYASYKSDFADAEDWYKKYN